MDKSPPKYTLTESKMAFARLSEIKIIPPSHNHKIFDETAVKARVSFGREAVAYRPTLSMKEKRAQIGLLQVELALKLEGCSLDAEVPSYRRSFTMKELSLSPGIDPSVTTTVSGEASGSGKIPGFAELNSGVKKSQTVVDRTYPRVVAQPSNFQLVASLPGNIWQIGLRNKGDPRYCDGSTTNLHGDDYIEQLEALCIVRPENQLDQYAFELTLRADLNQIVYSSNEDGRGEESLPVEPNGALVKKLCALQGHPDFERSGGRQYLLLNRARLRVERQDLFQEQDNVKAPARVDPAERRPDFWIDSTIEQSIDQNPSRSLASLARSISKDPLTFYEGIQLASIYLTQSDITECALAHDQLADAIILSNDEMQAYSKRHSAFENAHARDLKTLNSNAWHATNEGKAFARFLRKVRSAFNAGAHSLNAGSEPIDRLPLCLPYHLSCDRLVLSRTYVRELDTLRSMPKLKWLDLNDTLVIDLEPLRTLTNLEWLDLSYTPVIDLEPLRSLTNLQTLNLSGTNVVDLELLQGRLGLRTLNISRSKIKHLGPLAHLPYLESLDISDTEVTDLDPLQHLTRLRLLNMIGTKVTNHEPLQHLGKFGSLEILRVDYNSIGAEQVKRLREIGVRTITSHIL